MSAPTAAELELVALLRELIDIEGPQPSTGGWAAKVRAVLAKFDGEKA